MKKIISVLLFIFIASSASAQIQWFKGTFDDAKAPAKKENKQLMIFFSSGST